MNSRVRSALLAIVVALLVGDVVALGALTSRDDDARPTTSAGAAAASEDSSVLEPSPSVIAASTSPSDVAAGASTTHAASAGAETRGTTPPAIDRGAFAYSIEVQPACGARLQQMTAVVKAVPGVYVSIAVAYSDAQGFGAMYAGPVLPDGTLTYRWVVPAAAALGRGHVLSAARDTNTNTDGRAIAVFDVVEDASSC